jgi:hypothetical protein
VATLATATNADREANTAACGFPPLPAPSANPCVAQQEYNAPLLADVVQGVCSAMDSVDTAAMDSVDTAGMDSVGTAALHSHALQALFHALLLREVSASGVTHLRVLALTPEQAACLVSSLSSGASSGDGLLVCAAVRCMARASVRRSNAQQLLRHGAAACLSARSTLSLVCQSGDATARVHVLSTGVAMQQCAVGQGDVADCRALLCTLAAAVHPLLAAWREAEAEAAAVTTDGDVAAASVYPRAVCDESLSSLLVDGVSALREYVHDVHVSVGSGAMARDSDSRGTSDASPRVVPVVDVASDALRVLRGVHPSVLHAALRVCGDAVQACVDAVGADAVLRLDALSTLCAALLRRDAGVTVLAQYPALRSLLLTLVDASHAADVGAAPTPSTEASMTACTDTCVPATSPTDVAAGASTPWRLSESAAHAVVDVVCSAMRGNALNECVQGWGLRVLVTVLCRVAVGVDAARHIGAATHAALNAFTTVDDVQRFGCECLGLLLRRSDADADPHVHPVVVTRRACTALLSLHSVAAAATVAQAVALLVTSLPRVRIAALCSSAAAVAAPSLAPWEVEQLRSRALVVLCRVISRRRAEPLTVAASCRAVLALDAFQEARGVGDDRSHVAECESATAARSMCTTAVVTALEAMCREGATAATPYSGLPTSELSLAVTTLVTLLQASCEGEPLSSATVDVVLAAAIPPPYAACCGVACSQTMPSTARPLSRSLLWTSSPLRASAGRVHYASLSVQWVPPSPTNSCASSVTLPDSDDAAPEPLFVDKYVAPRGQVQAAKVERGGGGGVRGEGEDEGEAHSPCDRFRRSSRCRSPRCLPPCSYPLRHPRIGQRRLSVCLSGSCRGSDL